jgi:hypothetical protein
MEYTYNMTVYLGKDRKSQLLQWQLLVQLWQNWIQEHNIFSFPDLQICLNVQHLSVFH